MIQHLSIRVPWHDNGWNGTVCLNPESNTSCLRLKNILENRKNDLECSICGKCMLGHEKELPCISEGGTFMYDGELHRPQIHPYKDNNPETHGHFLETDVVYPPFSFSARPFAWLRYDDKEKHSYDKANKYGIKYDPSREPELQWGGAKSVWIQDAENHREIFKYFYQDVIPDESLCIAYAKQVPFVDDNRRVIIGMGHVKKIIPAIEHNHTEAGSLRSMIWETMICHSIRENHEDGFIIPYQKMMEYAESHPDFDMSSITVFAPDDAFEEFSNATEHVSYDSVIDVILSCIKAFRIINECLDEDYSNVISWLNIQLSRVWNDRGAFPGLGVMLTTFGIQLGIPVAREIKNKIKDNDNLWQFLDEVINNPTEYLSDSLVNSITPIIQKTWKSMPEERRKLFELLSRFSLSFEQADVLFYSNKREERNIFCSDLDIIDNPYILYEKTRLKQDDLYLSIQKVDRAVFPIASINEKYPLSDPTKLKSDNDERRIRAIIISVLESAADLGHTFLPVDILTNLVQNMTLEPSCKITSDMINAIESFISNEVLKREMKDGTEYYKLCRINEFDKEIETRIRKRMNAPKIDINTDWRKMLDDKFGENNDPSGLEEMARTEKAAVLKVLAESRISVLVGDAGTGKTTVLSVLCSDPSIAAGGILLLAPTGKATVRLMESVNSSNSSITALNVAQFLTQSKRFSWDDMRFRLSDQPYNDVPETVIIDESSMLTEEMFGALIQTIGRRAQRIIFVGDPNQLPPIGAGKPFVDLVNLLREELPDNQPLNEPKVCNNYGELSINRRQQKDKERLDVNLSRCFTRNNAMIDDEGIIADIIQDKSDNIKIYKWSTNEELEELILTNVANEIGMENINDQVGFDKAFGANVLDYETLFDKKGSEYVDKWQILAPVRNMVHGVVNINRLFHSRYRNHQIELSKRKGWNKKIPVAYGAEEIVYGDKVINIKNIVKKAYPEDETSKNYVANGEIGLACGNYAGKGKKATNYLQVSFSSQKGYTYSYDSRDFDEESGEETLELAYALTVHKAQGSQFDTVILVLSEPCRIISREMLYTALTRQVDKIIILYNDEPYHLMKYASENHSDIAKRFTDLFADIFPDDNGIHKPQIVKVGDSFFDEKLVHKTIRGDLVRSKSEVIIANALYSNGIEYEYEPELQIEGKIKRPDFKIIDADTGAVWYWEHCGMMSDEKYAKRWHDKEKFYEKNGIIKGKNLIVTEEYLNEGIDSSEIDSIVKSTFC